MTPIALTDRQRTDPEGTTVRAPSARAGCRAQALPWRAEGESVEGVADPLPREPPDGRQPGEPIPRAGRVRLAGAPERRPAPGAPEDGRRCHRPAGRPGDRLGPAGPRSARDAQDRAAPEPRPAGAPS